MKIRELTAPLEAWAPLSLQEDYDNCGLQLGDPEAEVDAAMVCLDCTEAVVEEAAAKGCGIIISHHPVIFRGLKSLVAKSHVERTVLSAIKHDIALYAIHTNLDNVIDGVNGEIATRLGLKSLRVLAAKSGQLRKLVVFVPMEHADAVRDAVFKAGGGHVGNYDECSFTVGGMGTFRPGPGTTPYSGEQGLRSSEAEFRLEFIYHVPLEQAIISAMLAAHPYEEVAYDRYPIANHHQGIGSGLVGEYDRQIPELEFLAKVKQAFGLQAIRHSKTLGRSIRRVALCGGSGAFLIRSAIAAEADAYITGDVKYHDFFEADGKLLLADIGHYGSEQFTMHLIQRRLGEHFPTFAVRLTETVTDPIHHY